MYAIRAPDPYVPIVVFRNGMHSASVITVGRSVKPQSGVLDASQSTGTKPHSPYPYAAGTVHVDGTHGNFSASFPCPVTLKHRSVPVKNGRTSADPKPAIRSRCQSCNRLPV